MPYTELNDSSGEKSKTNNKIWVNLYTCQRDINHDTNTYLTMWNAEKQKEPCIGHPNLGKQPDMYSMTYEISQRDYFQLCTLLKYCQYSC